MKLRNHPHLNILFIARAYPPTSGGMENFAFQLHEHLQERANVIPVINHRGKKALPVFLPYATAAAVHHIRSGGIDSVHLADAMLAPVGAAIKAATGATVTASICGLDVTYENELYQRVVINALKRLDLALPISAATDAAMHERTGLGPSSEVISLGVNPLLPPDRTAIDEFNALVPRPEGSRLILTVGRLIERKGVAWFIENVVPLLPNEAMYCVIGDGSMRKEIDRLTSNAGMVGRVRVLGWVPDHVLAAAYGAADIFVMPNIRVAGDMEGFGLVALEASASGLPVVASNLDGIPAAIHHGRNGVLVAPTDAAVWAAEIRSLLALPTGALANLGDRFRSYTMHNFGWSRTAAQYIEAISATVEERTAAA